jgi:hypothetical protein
MVAATVVARMGRKDLVMKVVVLLLFAIWNVVCESDVPKRGSVVLLICLHPSSCLRSIPFLVYVAQTRCSLVSLVL